MPGGSRHAPRSSQPQSSQARSSQQGPRQAVAGGSVDEGRIADVIRPVVAAAGMDLEAIRVSAAGRRRLLRVVVDSDGGVSLDDAATISRQLSAALDAVAVMGDFPYTLEVSSPGVDRPLTDPRHWRRAVGHLVQVSVTEAGVSGISGVSGTISGRIVTADSDGVTLDVGGSRHRFGYPALGAGAVQVEFGHPQPELGATRDGH
jgi:ribosome maturation factor RimP